MPGITPNTFALGDFNGDGKLDIAVPDQYGTTVSVYLNQGGGNFGTPVVTHVSIPTTLGGIVSGDFNEDGKDDLVVGTVSGTEEAIVMLSNGDGSFSQQPAIANSFGFFSGKVADLNGDHHADLLLGGNGTGFPYFGNGDGTFTRQTFPSGSFPGDYFSVAVGDFSGTKHLDAVLADTSDPVHGGGSLDYFPGTVGGGFGTPTFYHSIVLDNPDSLDVADFNGDGKLDILVSGSNGSFVVFGNGDGTFQVSTSSVAFLPLNNYPVVGSESVQGAVADLNQDGKPDGVVLESRGIVSLFLNDGTGTFRSAASKVYTFQVPAPTYALKVGDLNGDGLPDIVVASQAHSLSLIYSIKAAVASAVSLATSQASVLTGSPLTFTAKVAGGTVVPTGTVTLMDGGSTIGQLTLDQAGGASFNVSNLAVGTHSISVAYSGDSNFSPATSSVTESITDFQVSASPTTQTIAPGASASYNLTIAPEAGFTGSINLTCSGLPSLATCTVPSSSVTGSPTTVTLTIGTTATTYAFVKSGYAPMLCCGLLGSIPWFLFRRKALRFGTLSLSIAVLSTLLLSAGILGCSGSSPKRAIPGTPGGSSSITLAASTVQNGVTVTHNVPLVLTIQ